MRGVALAKIRPDENHAPHPSRAAMSVITCFPLPPGGPPGEGGQVGGLRRRKSPCAARFQRLVVQRASLSAIQTSLNGIV
jgi:hypothetical protein